jgi:hypothetical protein
MDQDSLRCRILHQLRPNSAATRSKKWSHRAPGLLSVKSSRRPSWHNMIKHRMDSHGRFASLSPLHAEWKSWEHRGDRRGWEWGFRSRTTDIFTDIIEGAGSLYSVAQKQQPLINGISMYAFALRGPLTRWIPPILPWRRSILAKRAGRNI